MDLIPASMPTTDNKGSLATAEHNRCDLLELSVGYGLILLAVWTPQPWQRQFYWAGLTWVLLATAFSFDGLSAMGLRISGALRAPWVVGLALLVAAIAVCVADSLHTLHIPEHPVLFIERYWAYAIWAFVQEFLLMDFFLLRLLRLLPGKKMAVLAAAGLFALAHLPNPVLAPVTLLWGIVACLLFLQYRNLYILGMAHAIFGICIATTVPGPIDHNMRVGLGYLSYRHPVHHQRSQIDHIVSTHAWVIADAPTRRS
jgi:hypothetical protein